MVGFLDGSKDLGHFRLLPILNYEGRFLQDNNIVIVELKHWDYKTGYPVESDFVRCRVSSRLTVAGIDKYLICEPNFDFPFVPKWADGCTCMGNSNCQSMYFAVIS